LDAVSVIATTLSGLASALNSCGGSESSPVAPIAGFATGAPTSITGAWNRSESIAAIS
jgi:hypothetical protein